MRKFSTIATHKKRGRISPPSDFPYNFICLAYNLQSHPPSLSSSADAKGAQERIDVVHGGCTVATPQPFKLTVADSCHDCFIASQLDNSVVMLNYFCLIVKGLSVVGGLQFVSLHDVASFLCCGWYLLPALLTVCIVAQKRLFVK